MLLQFEVSDFFIELTLHLTNLGERYAEIIVAAEQNLKNQVGKPGKCSNHLLMLL